MSGMRQIVVRAYLLLGTGMLLGIGGCLGQVQRELSVLLTPEAESMLIRDSLLANVLGPELLARLLF